MAAQVPARARQAELVEVVPQDHQLNAALEEQIRLARRSPRSLEQVVQRITTFATLDEETAEEAMYVLPRAGKDITGPSARFAEIVASQYGNSRLDGGVDFVDRNEGFVQSVGFFHDLETNSVSTARVRRRIVDKYGKLYNEDMIIVTGNAATSIARRNAVLAGVPKPVWRGALARTQQVVAGKVKSVASAREIVISKFVQDFNVPPKALAHVLGLATINDANFEHVIKLKGMYATLKNNEATIEEMFGEHLSTATGKALPVNTGPEIPEAEETSPEGKSEQQQTPAQDKQAPAAEQQVRSRDETSAQKSTLLPKVEQAKKPEADEDLFPGDRPSTAPAPGEGEGLVAEIETAIRNCEDIDELEGLQKRFSQRIRQQPNNVAERCRKAISDAIFAAT